MNPRVSRSSALASKATGFPIAKIAARLAVGYTLQEIPNDITKATPASFEPAIDYCVVKWPRFAFEKFPGAEPGLTTHMKSVGEAMAIGRTFKQAFAKALRSRELDSRPGPPARRRGAARAALAAPRGRALRPPARGAAPRHSRSTSCTGARASTRGSCASWPSSSLIPRRRSPASARSSRSTPARPSSPPRRRTSTRPGSDPARPRRRPRGPHRGRPRRAPERRDPRLGPEPDRPGDRVRLLLRPRRPDRPRAGPRRGHDQLQPGDGLDRLRHLRPPVLRAADARGRARGLRGRDSPKGWSSSSAARRR